MSLYNDLTTVLSPYATKIKQNKSGIDDIQDAVADISNHMPYVSVVLTSDDMTVETGKRWKDDGTTTAYIYADAVSFDVDSGQSILISGRTNTDAAYAVRWKLADDSIVSVTEYDSTQPLVDKEFTAPTNAVKALISFNFPSSNPYVLKKLVMQQAIGGSALLNASENIKSEIDSSFTDATLADFGWSKNGELPINYDNLTNGYLNTSGVIQTQSPTRLEYTTDYIEIPEASLIQVTSTADSAPWVRVCVYDANKTFLREAGSKQGSDSEQTASVEFVAQYNAKYMRVSYRSYGNRFACTTIRTNRYDVSDKLYVEEKTGYIDASGGIVGTADATRQEVYTGYYPITEGVSLTVLLNHISSVGMWCCYAAYDKQMSFVERVTIIEKSAYGGRYTLDDSNIARLIGNGAAYIRFSYRTYGEHGFYLSTNNKTFYTQNVLNLGDENASRWSSFVRSINHRGYNTVAPENTLPAYKLSRKMGFDYAECDVSFTSDGVPVLLHDLSINRTGRNADGTTISGTITINSITYAQALEYDFGIWKGQEYAGTKIPTLKQVVTLCRNIGLHLYIELKADGITRELAERCVDIVKECGMSDNVTWISFSYLALGFVKDYASDARLGYVVMDGITDNIITTATGMKTAENEVFIDSKTYTGTEISRCASAGFPLEVWTVNSSTDIIGLDPYISGVTSDSAIAGKILYESEY